MPNDHANAQHRTLRVALLPIAVALPLVACGAGAATGPGPLTVAQESVERDRADTVSQVDIASARPAPDAQPRAAGAASAAARTEVRKGVTEALKKTIRERQGAFAAAQTDAEREAIRESMEGLHRSLTSLQSSQGKVDHLQAEEKRLQQELVWCLERTLAELRQDKRELDQIAEEVMQGLRQARTDIEAALKGTSSQPPKAEQQARQRMAMREALAHLDRQAAQHAQDTELARKKLLLAESRIEEKLSVARSQATPGVAMATD